MINVQNYRKGFGSCPDCPVSIEFLLIHTGNVLLFFKSKFDKEKCDDKQEHFYHLILWMAFGKVFLNRKYSLKTPKCMPSFSSLPVAWIVVFVGLILARGPYVWHPWSKPDNNISLYCSIGCSSFTCHQLSFWYLPTLYVHTVHFPYGSILNTQSMRCRSDRGILCLLLFLFFGTGTVLRQICDTEWF